MTSSRVAALAAGVIVALLLLSSLRFVVASADRISALSSLQVDAAAYDAIGRSLSQSWSLTAIPPLQPPGFVTVLAVVFTLAGHSWLAAKLVLWGCLVASTVLAGALARAVYGSRAAGWWAAGLCAASPALAAYGTTLQYELLAALLVLILIAAAWWSARLAPGARRAAALAACGAGAGLSVLTREVLIVLVPIVAVYLAARLAARRTDRWRTAALVALYVSCAAAPPLIWSAVQSTRTGRVVAVSDKGPLVLAFGNNPAANGTFNAPLVGTPEPAGWPYIAAHPGGAAWLAVRKAGYLWGVLRDGWNVPRPAAFAAARATAGVVPIDWLLPWARGGWLLIATVAALVGWRRDTWRDWWLVPGAVAGVMAVHLVTVASYRFAVPVLPLIFVMAAGPVARAAGWIGRRRWAVALAVALAAGAAAMQWGAWPLRYRLAAATLDGVQADNRVDESTGRLVRVADAARGERVVLLLTDEYFASGPMDIVITARADSAAIPGTPAFHAGLLDTSGRVLCGQAVTTDALDRHVYSDVRIPCRLDHAGPVTFLVRTLGTTTVSFDRVELAWHSRR